MPRTKIGAGEGSPAAAKAVEQAGVERVGNEPESSLTGRFVVIDFAAFQSIALEPMLEGAAIVADVFERLAERKVDVHHLVGGQSGPRRRQALRARRDRDRLGERFSDWCDCNALRRGRG